MIQFSTDQVLRIRVKSARYVVTQIYDRVSACVNPIHSHRRSDICPEHLQDIVIRMMMLGFKKERSLIYLCSWIILYGENFEYQLDIEDAMIQSDIEEPEKINRIFSILRASLEIHD